MVPTPKSWEVVWNTMVPLFGARNEGHSITAVKQKCILHERVEADLAILGSILHWQVGTSPVHVPTESLSGSSQVLVVDPSRA